MILNNSFLKKIVNDIYLTAEEEEILKKYNIDYLNCKNVSDLIFKIEYYLNNNNELNDLELLEERLSEYNYYNNTNK